MQYPRLGRSAPSLPLIIFMGRQLSRGQLVLFMDGQHQRGLSRHQTQLKPHCELFTQLSGWVAQLRGWATQHHQRQVKWGRSSHRTHSLHRLIPQTPRSERRNDAKLRRTPASSARCRRGRKPSRIITTTAAKISPRCTTDPPLRMCALATSTPMTPSQMTITTCAFSRPTALSCRPTRST